MTQIEEKQALCSRHRALLQILMNYGTSGVMLLPQLRALCLAWGIFPSAQAVNRAVRDLRAAGISNRQTWVDNNSDLLLARKFVWRYFAGKNSQDIATPRRPATMVPYILQARKIDRLLTAIERQHLTSAEAAETCLRRHACTMFLRLPDLPDYYRRYARLFSEEHPENYDHRAAPGAARTDNGDNDTPAQPQPQAMGAPRSDPRRGEIPVELTAVSRLMISQRLIGVSSTNGSAFSYKLVMGDRSVKTLFVLQRTNPHAVSLAGAT